jgi:hypothetical protein
MDCIFVTFAVTPLPNGAGWSNVTGAAAGTALGTGASSWIDPAGAEVTGGALAAVAGAPFTVVVVVAFGGAGVWEVDAVRSPWLQPAMATAAVDAQISAHIARRARPSRVLDLRHGMH